ncbi:MAG: hypothetical protein J6584_04975 [Lactobacillus sp.]|uniref:hypothetical protein n=1 Tax=Bombilactobacillus bombi TaxID=1303590 RepID=UPI0035E476C9|nr:hypothetical protein [Lactobacillus sp.]
MKNFKILIVGLISCIALIGGISLYTSHHASLKISEVKTINTKSSKRKKITNKKFYKGNIREIPGDTLFVDYPKSFNGLISKGKATILGTVTNLQDASNDSLPNRPMTMATIAIDQILAGKLDKQETKVKVLFMGGNIANNKLLRDVSNKDYLTPQQREAAQSNKIITVKYSYMPLPQIGKKYALIISPEKKGVNGIPEVFYMPIYSGKGVFIRNSKGQYLREAEPQPVGGGDGTKSSNTSENDDLIMNRGMNNLIRKSNTTN